MLATLVLAAADADPMKSQPGLAITALVVFSIAFGALSIFVWPKIVKGLDDRNEPAPTDALREVELLLDHTFYAFLVRRRNPTPHLRARDA